MRYMYDLRDKLCKELEELSGHDLDMSSLEAIDKLTHSIKCIDTIMAMEGYSRDGRSYDDEGGSYRRGRSMTTGRYISRASGRYSRDYSRDDRMREKLEEMMQDAPDENTRRELERLISKM